MAGSNLLKMLCQISIVAFGEYLSLSDKRAPKDWLPNLPDPPTPWLWVRTENLTMANFGTMSLGGAPASDHSYGWERYRGDSSHPNEVQQL